MTAFYDKLPELDPGRETLILTLLDGSGMGEKALLSDGEIVWTSGQDEFFSLHAGEAQNVTGVQEIDGRRVYSERLEHEKKIVICGAGHVSIPIIRLGRMIGCRVTCIDDRPSFAGNAREAGADPVLCDSFENALNTITGDKDTFFVIVTRGHRWDQQCLKAIAAKPHAYIGLMGSVKRVRMVKENLLRSGVPKDVLDEVHTPIGLKIGAETPEEIAVSVMAEIIEVKNRHGRGAGYPDAILKALGQPGRKVLLTLIARRGSAPRSVGTKMLVLPDGTCVGTIGGGCAEAALIQKARDMLSGGTLRPQLYHVDLAREEAAEAGMVCGGTLELLLEVL
ncbi:MAG: XdhC family protein [Fretibacterium sp.]|nr:XdhC family protein [Fretibacterium sp.]